MKKRITALLGVLLLFALTPCAAWAEELLVGGQAVGIEINADGVIVSGFCEVQTEKGVVCPAREAGFAVGDLIVGMDGAPIRSAEDLIAASAARRRGDACVRQRPAARLRHRDLRHARRGRSRGAGGLKGAEKASADALSANRAVYIKKVLTNADRFDSIIKPWPSSSVG